MAFRVHAVLGNIPGMLPYLLGIWGFQAVVSAVLVIVLVIIKLSPTIILAPVFNVCSMFLLSFFLFPTNRPLVADLQEKKVWTIWIPAMMYHTRTYFMLYKIQSSSVCSRLCASCLEGCFHTTRYQNAHANATHPGR